MERSFLYVSLFFLALGASQADKPQHEGVKGGHYQQHASRPANETGLCYKRVSYSEAIGLNTTGQVHIVHPGVGQGVKTNRYNSSSGGWVTVIDCCEGYQRDTRTGKCTVYCEGGCVGGVCSPGGICTCEPGWYPESGTCKPICRQPCQRDAYCFAPDVCACKYGYEETQNGQCRPICPGGCANGECVAPQVCRCRPGYVLNDNRICEPVCEGGCPHGECTSPGVCTCYRGYVNPPGETEACLPDCGPSNCNGGECVSPGICICGSGYVLDYATNTCVSACRNGCPPNGRCVGPNECACEPGFILDAQNRRCVGGTQCDRPCLNGQCTGYNTCTCNNGYVPDPRDPTGSRCVAGCAGGCPNGVCSGPNFCICKPGYVKDRSVKGSQRCIPREERY